MDLLSLLRPVDLTRFKQEFYGKTCLLLKRKSNPFESLLSLEQLEDRLNDGVATLSGMSVIRPNGIKMPPQELVTEQTVAAWAPRFTRKSLLKQCLEEGHSFVLHNMSAITKEVEALVADIESTFQSSADVHIYVSPGRSATGYQAHKDTPQHKLYLQLIGSTDWTVFSGQLPAEDRRRSLPYDEAVSTLGVDFRATLTPGSVLYMPPGVFHHATNPESPRVSLSIPFYEMKGAIAVDRTPIPLRELFEKAT